MTPDFTGVHLKLDRAAEHLDSLESLLDAFLEGDAHDGTSPGLTVEGDSDKGVWSVTAHLPQEVPVAWSLIIGEALYQLRSSLDHIVNVLTGDRDSRSSFPVFTRQQDYAAKRDSYLVGVPDEHRRTIDSLQPFVQNPTRPRVTTLWALNELARLDRHRFLHIADLWLLHCQISSDPPSATVLDYAVELPWSVEDGAIVAQGRILPIDGDHREVRVALAAGVDFVLPDLRALKGSGEEEVQGARALEGLRQMHRHAMEILALF